MYGWSTEIRRNFIILIKSCFLLFIFRFFQQQQQQQPLSSSSPAVHPEYDAATSPLESSLSNPNLMSTSLPSRFFSQKVRTRDQTCKAWLPDGDSQMFSLYVFGPSGLKDYGSATLRCKIWSLPFLGLRQGGGRGGAIQVVVCQYRVTHHVVPLVPWHQN